MQIPLIGAPTTNEVIEKGLEELRNKDVVTLKDLGLLINKVHRLGTEKKYKGILTEKLAKEFFVIETAIWWKYHRDNYDTFSTVTLSTDMVEYLAAIVKKITKSPHVEVRDVWLSRDLIYQLGALHLHLNKLLDYEGDTMSGELSKEKVNKLLLAEINTIFVKDRIQ